MSESRLSRICRHGRASREEREVLSRLLGVSEDELFGGLLSFAECSRHSLEVLDTPLKLVGSRWF